jgi:hypothetical protein
MEKFRNRRAKPDTSSNIAYDGLKNMIHDREIIPMPAMIVNPPIR